MGSIRGGGEACGEAGHLPTLTSWSPTALLPPSAIPNNSYWAQKIPPSIPRPLLSPPPFLSPPSAPTALIEEGVGGREGIYPTAASVTLDRLLHSPVRPALPGTRKGGTLSEATQ